MTKTAKIRKMRLRMESNNLARARPQRKVRGGQNGRLPVLSASRRKPASGRLNHRNRGDSRDYSTYPCGCVRCHCQGAGDDRFEIVVGRLPIELAAHAALRIGDQLGWIPARRGPTTAGIGDPSRAGKRRSLRGRYSRDRSPGYTKSHVPAVSARVP